MAATAGAVHLDPRHPIAAIGRRRDRAVDRPVEARPSGAALELRVGGEERLAAGAARKRAFTFFDVQRARAGALGTVLAQDVELLRRQRLPPLLVCLISH